jgi:hypothetical protein
MVCCYYGHEETPATINEKLKNSNGFANGGYYVWGSLSRIYPDIKEKMVETPAALTNGQVQEIRSGLDNGFPVMVHVDYNPKTVQSDMHFSPFVDYNANDENDFTLADTLGGRVHTLKEYLKWFKPRMRDTVEAYIIYEGPVKKEEEKPVEKPVEPSIPSGSLPENYGDTVKMATQYRSVVEYLEIPSRAEDTMFVDCRRVIAGYKSAKTDLQNKMIEAQKDAASRQVQVDSLSKEIGILNEELIRREKLHKAELDSLKTTFPNVEDLRKQWQAVYDEVKKKYDEEVALTRELQIKIAEKNAEKTALENEAKDEIRIKKEAVSKLGNFITNLFRLRW